MLLLSALVVGLGNAWADEVVTYTVSSTSSVTTTGTAPTGSSVSYSQTYGTACQATSGNSFTLTLKNWNGYTISNITLSMHSNGSKGAGNLQYSDDGGETFYGIIATSNFSSANWNGSYTTDYTDISQDVSIAASSDDVIIKINATTNSLYCESYTITYAPTPSGSEEATTTTIDASGITNTNKFISTAAGTLTAVVKDESDAAIGGATVTWTSSKPAVATIGSTTGVVTLVGKGTTKIRASYAGVDDEYLPSYDEYELTVIDEDPNAQVIWSEDFTGYAANAVPSGGTYGYSCVNGGSDTKIYTDYMAGGASPELLVGKSTGSFSATIPLDKYYGNLKLSYKTNAKSMTISTSTTGLSTSGTTSFYTAGEHEVTFTGITAATTSITIVFTPGSDNVRLDDIELKGRMAAPQFSVPAGDVSAGTSVTLSATAGATIYYTTDGSTPTSSSSAYSSALTIDETTTIKAIAVKSGKESSVATATYTVTTEPVITLGKTSVAATDAETDGTITVIYSNLTNYDSDINWYEADGTTPATYDWIDAGINTSTKYVDYSIGENDTYSSRTAYMKVYALGDEGDVESELITITQAGKTVDFVTLPFSWAGGTSSELTATTGVTAEGLGSDYAVGNAPYRVKMDSKDDYILIKTNEQPVQVMIGIKMIGGAETSKIKVQESANGSSFADVEEFSISGSQNDILNLKTSESFATTTRYVKIIKSAHGSNIGVGPILITNFEGITATVTSAGWATFCSDYALDLENLPSGLKAYEVLEDKVDQEHNTLTATEVTEAVAAGTGLLLKGTAGSYSIPVAVSGATHNNNKLVGVTDADGEDVASASKYVLTRQNNQVVFAPTNGANTPHLAKGQAYLDLTTSSPAPSAIRIILEEENATSVENIQATEQAVKYFENGILYIKRNGVVFDALGRIVK